MRAVRVFAVVLVVTCSSGSAAALRLPSAPRCPVFPRSNPWNRRVDKLPIAANSATLIRSMGLDTGLHADFGSGTWDGGPIGIPFDVVTHRTPRAKVSFEYADESDRVGYPIPRRVHIEYGSDHHAVLVDRDACRLYELGGLQRVGGRWRFAQRRPHSWYYTDWEHPPVGPLKMRVPGQEPQVASLPDAWPSWNAFWAS